MQDCHPVNNTPEGREALIHLHVPAALKARWVRESRTAGMKLTDWIIKRVEGATMNVYKITDALASQYHGSGWALAAITGDQVVALRYIADVVPDQIADAVAEGGQHAAFFVRQWLATAQAGPVVRELQALGQVSVGMCSCWEFVEQ